MDGQNQKPKTFLRELAEKQGVQVLIWLGGIFVLILNVWLTTQLAPMAQDIALIKQTQAQLKHDNSDDVSYRDFDVLDKRLTRIENKLDSLLERK